MPLQMSLFDASLPRIPREIFTYANQLQRVAQTVSGAPPAVRLTRGLCRFCGCHGNSCLDQTVERCDWIDATETCCTAKPCRARLASAMVAASTSKPPVSQKPAKPASKKRRYAGDRVDRAWIRYFSS